MLQIKISDIKQTLERIYADQQMSLHKLFANKVMLIGRYLPTPVFLLSWFSLLPEEVKSFQKFYDELPDKEFDRILETEEAYACLALVYAQDLDVDLYDYLFIQSSNRPALISNALLSVFYQWKVQNEVVYQSWSRRIYIENFPYLVKTSTPEELLQVFGLLESQQSKYPYTPAIRDFVFSHDYPRAALQAIDAGFASDVSLGKQILKKIKVSRAAEPVCGDQQRSIMGPNFWARPEIQAFPDHNLNRDKVLRFIL